MPNSAVTVEHTTLPVARRLIVLVPRFNIDEIAFGRRIWDLALIHLSDVLYTSVVRNLDEELHDLHRMTILSAVTNDARFHVETQIQFGLPWHKSLRRLYRSGDLIVCTREQAMNTGAFWRKPFVEQITSQLNIPVYVLPTSDDPAELTINDPGVKPAFLLIPSIISHWFS